MVARRRRRLQPRGRVPLEPKGSERLYTANLRRVWRVAQQIMTMAIEPLLEIWPSETEDGGYLEPTARAPRLGPLVTGGRGRRRPLDPRFGTFPGSRERTQEPPRRRIVSGPFARPRRQRRITSMSDSELRNLWPNIDPAEVREFAPWATSREEVYRLSYPAGSPDATVFDLESRVQAGISSARQNPSSPPVRAPAAPSGRLPGAFQLRRLPEGALPIIFDEGGNPLPPPPRPQQLSVLAIRGQMSWAQQALQAVLTEGNLSLMIGQSATSVRRHSHRDLNRVLAINIREEVPGMQSMINVWREQNINLIESGIMAPHQHTKLRSSLFADVSRVVEQAHTNGLRVEVLASELVERYNVSESRAELIARDQTLKLNGQITHARQVNAGVRRYRWVTSNDERVRPEHAALDGSIQSWNSPPSVGDGRSEHPGGDYNCRCIAQAIPPDWLTSE